MVGRLPLRFFFSFFRGGRRTRWYMGLGQSSPPKDLIQVAFMKLVLLKSKNYWHPSQITIHVCRVTTASLLACFRGEGEGKVQVQPLAPSPWKQASKAAGKLTVVTLQYGCVTLRHVDVAATYGINVSHVLYVKNNPLRYVALSTCDIATSIRCDI